MKKINITTPENIELELTLAQVLSRTTAAMVDSLIQGIIFAVIILGAYEISKTIKGNIEDYIGWLIGITLLLIEIIHYGYYVISEITMGGQSVGKRIMHLRVVRDNGAPITVKESVIRNLFRVFIDELGIGVIMMFFGKKKKRLGDLVAGTIVVVEEENEMPTLLEVSIVISDELRGYLTAEEYNLLQEYFDRKKTMADYTQLQKQIRKYFTERLTELEIYDENEDFVEQL